MKINESTDHLAIQNGTITISNNIRLTDFPALSKPRIKMQYSSFWKRYFQSPDSNANILLYGQVYLQISLI